MDFMCASLAQITLKAKGEYHFTMSCFYGRLKPSTPKAAFPLARGLCDGRTDSSPFVGACAATFRKHRHRSAISSAGRSSSTLVRSPTTVKKGGPSGTVLVSMLRQTQGGIGVERSSSRALQTIRGETASAEETLSPLLPSLIDCTTEVRLAGSGGLRKNNSERFRAVCTAWRTSREEKGSVSCTMKISVKTLKGNHFDLNVQPDDTVRASLSLPFALFFSLSLSRFLSLSPSFSVSLPTSCRA